MAKFSCFHCAKTFHNSENHWYGALKGIAKRRCGGCGRWLERRLGPDQIRKDSLELTCPGCSAISDAKVQWERYRNSSADPFFGLPLWLQTSCCGHVLWAYNLRHLSFLESFISAKLRIRTPNRNSTLVSRAPLWLKSAKSRAAALKAIITLKTKAGTQER